MRGVWVPVAGGRWVDGPVGARSSLERSSDGRPPPPPALVSASSSASGQAAAGSSSQPSVQQNIGNLMHMAGG